MSTLDELIEQFCKDGVDYFSIGSVVEYEQPSSYIVTNTDYSNGYSIPVLTAGQSFILGFTNENEGIYNASKDNPVIIFDDFTGSFKWVDFAFKVKSSAMKMLTAKSDKVLLRFIYHTMGKIGFSSNEHKRLWISMYSEIIIPIPPLPIQLEIVRILDTFTNLQAELEAELEAREKQFNYYRNHLLSFKDDVRRIPLINVATVSRGVRVTKKELTEDGQYPVFQNSLSPMGFYNSFNCPSHTTYVISAGAAGEIGFCKSEFWAADDCLVITSPGDVLNKFIYYFLLTKQDTILAQVRNASIPRLSRIVVENLEIPIPSTEDQQRIVSILDRYDELCNDYTIGLPAEIEARRKQYEFYRNKLLTFKEKIS